MPPVLINARAATRPELGGVERWARELAQRLPALDAARYGVARPRLAFTHRLGHAWEQTLLPLNAAVARAELLLCPANLAPLAWPRTLLVLHDVAALRGPQWYSPSYVRWQQALLPRVARRARLIVTVSEFSREEICATLGVSRERVVVVPGGVDHERFHPGVDATASAHELGLVGPYVLTLASRTARKNRAALATTAKRLRSAGLRLVLAGGGRPQFAGEAAVPDAIDLGYVEERLLPGLYAGAELFVLPSLHEGFGLTCLEAMACGTPVVAAAAGALPQTCGDAARYADPRDPAGLADVVMASLADAALSSRGIVRASEFSWDQTARTLDAVVADLLASR